MITIIAEWSTVCNKGLIKVDIWLVGDVRHGCLTLVRSR